jgi:hypothetical protein
MNNNTFGLPKWGNSSFLTYGKRFEVKYIEKNGNNTWGYVDAEDSDSARKFVEGFGHRCKEVFLVLQ